MAERAIVVGGGIMGLSTAWALRKRGFAVTLYEQHEIPNELGSSVDAHRLIRHVYGAERGYARMVDDAFAAWDRLWADLGRSHYTPTGTLAIASAAGDWLEESLATLATIGRPAERLDAGRVTARYPFLRGDDIAGAFCCETGGFLAAREICTGLAAWLQAQGAAVRPHTAVAGIDPETAHVDLADGTRAAADHVVIAAGPWVTRLLPDFAGAVTPSRQVACYLEPPPELAAAWTAAPMVLDIDADAGFYLVPPRPGYGMKMGDHTFSLTGDPEADRTASAAERDAVIAHAAHRLTGFADYRVAETRTCFYTVQPEERFIVAPLGARGWVMTGFSGHGFKFGALMGEAMAAAIAGERPPEDLTSRAAGDAV